jgi:hypothetical protein
MSLLRPRGNVAKPRRIHGEPLALNDYQAANLRWLLGLVGYPAPLVAVGDFACANTGDWVGEIYLRIPETDYKPNGTREDVITQSFSRVDKAVAAARAEWEARRPQGTRSSCDCDWSGGPQRGTIGDAVPFLQPCAGHSVYGDWRVKQARAEWEADHEKNGGSTYFNEMVHLQRKCVALGTDVETYKRLALENGAARDHAIKEWHLSQDRNAELSAKLDEVIEELKSAQQEDVVQVGSRCWRAEVELEKARARLQEPGPGRFTCDRCGKVTPNSEGGDDSAPGACATCWALRECQVALSAISSALVDAGSVVVEPYADAVRELTRQRNNAAKGHDHWKAEAERRQGTIDKLTAERDEAKVAFGDTRLALVAANDRAVRIALARDSEKARADKAEAELATRDGEMFKDDLRAVRRETLEAVQKMLRESGRRSDGGKLDELHAWLRAQFAETKTCVADPPHADEPLRPVGIAPADDGHLEPAPSPCPACAQLGHKRVHPAGTQCPHYSRGHHPELLPSDVCVEPKPEEPKVERPCILAGPTYDYGRTEEPKAERVGQWSSRTAWRFTCCGVEREHRGAEELMHMCSECRAVWRRPTP